jgi:hypothetical protein
MPQGRATAHEGSGRVAVKIENANGWNRLLWKSAFYTNGTDKSLGSKCARRINRVLK